MTTAYQTYRDEMQKANDELAKIEHDLSVCRTCWGERDADIFDTALDVALVNHSQKVEAIVAEFRAALQPVKTDRKFVVKINGQRIMSFRADSPEAAHNEAVEQLSRPGRYSTLLAWTDAGMVIDEE